MIRLALRVRRSDAELVLADLLELAPGGVEELDLPRVDGGDMVEYAVYGSPGELPELPDLRAVAGGALIEISTSEIPDDWSERWKRFHKPVLVEPPQTGPDRKSVPALHVRPPWEGPHTDPGVLEIVIDPAQAFGTGAHATTRLCLELLLELAASEETRGAVLDVGSGSGVLAIAAVKLGYEPVLALDHDGESVRAIVANAAVNGVQIEAREFDLRREPLPWLGGEGDGGGVPVGLRAADDSERPARHSGRTVVLANLLRPLLLELAGTMSPMAAPDAFATSESSAKSELPAKSQPSDPSNPSESPAHFVTSAPSDASAPPTPPERLELIASGLLCEQADEVAAAFAKRLGLLERARRERGEWVALWLTSAVVARSPRAPSP
jgi:ribosomal protein L11 methyltransferase